MLPRCWEKSRQEVNYHTLRITGGAARDAAAGAASGAGKIPTSSQLRVPGLPGCPIWPAASARPGWAASGSRPGNPGGESKTYENRAERGEKYRNSRRPGGCQREFRQTGRPAQIPSQHGICRPDPRPKRRAVLKNTFARGQSFAHLALESATLSRETDSRKKRG